MPVAAGIGGNVAEYQTEITLLAGTLILEDITIVFRVDANNIAHWTVCEILEEGAEETLTGPSPAFLAALGIALHHDGIPDADRDYPAAETTQHRIRWIP